LQWWRSQKVNVVQSDGSSVVLDKVVDYFHYWYRFRYADDVPDMDIPVEICLELLAAADYLGLDQYVLRRPSLTSRRSNARTRANLVAVK
jgi:elongin-C